MLYTPWLPAAAQESAEPPLDEIVEQFFPGYVVMRESDLDRTVRNHTASNPVYDGVDRTPTVIRADFDGNGVADYALLVRADTSDEPDEVFAVLLGQGKGAYSRAAQAFFGGVVGQVYLGYAPAGSVLVPARHSTVAREAVTLTLPAVKLIYYESSADAFYWDASLNRLASMPTEQ